MAMNKARPRGFGSPQPPGKVEDHWSQAAHRLWGQHRQQEALECLEGEIALFPRNRPPHQQSLQRVLYLFNRQDYGRCEAHMRHLQRCYPQEILFIENLAVMLMKQGKFEEAKPWMQRLEQQARRTTNQLDMLCDFYWKTGNREKSRSYGEQSLACKSRAAKPLPDWAPPPSSPEAWLQGRAGRNVVAFSLWGQGERYLSGARRNMELVPQLYPGWAMRIYCDRTVPHGLLQEAEQRGVEIIPCPDGQNLREKLCRRFLVANDPAVGRFLVRDIDSVVSQRERRAVDAWINSGRWFHVMRDWWTHTDPILAGMWGGVAGTLPDLQPLLAAYQTDHKDTPNIDQEFLRDVLWGSISHHALIHDRCFRSSGSIPWPDPDPPIPVHVGRNESAGQ